MKLLAGIVAYALIVATSAVILGLLVWAAVEVWTRAVG